jgi:hypothetical protein
MIFSGKTDDFHGWKSGMVDGDDLLFLIGRIGGYIFSLCLICTHFRININFWIKLDIVY